MISSCKGFSHFSSQAIHFLINEKVVFSVRIHSPAKESYHKSLLKKVLPLSCHLFRWSGTGICVVYTILIDIIASNYNFV